MLIILSGPLCAGKSSLAGCLQRRRGGTIITAREILAGLGSDPNNRADLQARGAELERATSGRWLLDGVIAKLPQRLTGTSVVDSVRTTGQAELFRSRFVDSIVIHLTAVEDVLRQRFLATDEGKAIGEQGMRRVFRHPVERGADDVRALADIVIDTTGKSVATVCDEALAAVTALAGGTRPPSA